VAFAAGIQRNLETVMAENKDLETTKKQFKNFSGKLKSAVSDPCSAPIVGSIDLSFALDSKPAHDEL